MKLRFAPSPTGYLHVGNARPALLNALLARRLGAEFQLRIDDTDPGRSRPEYEQAIERDLAWLGIAWDERLRQSDRHPVYAAAADRLRASGRLYPCFESEEELRAKREQRIRRRQPPIYDRAMLALTPEQRAAAEAGGKRPYWRFRLSDAPAAWDDLVAGPRQVKLSALSDPVLVRADGSPTYTLASVADDLDSGITHVLRGEDHVGNTGMHLDILAALSGAPARIRFGHAPLLVDQDGGKLSKRLESLSLRSLRGDGVEPVAVTGYLARIGTARDPAPLPIAGLAADFSLADISRSPPRFDMRQLLALNRQALAQLPFDAVRDRLPAGATEPFWRAVRGNLDLLNEARLWWQVVTGDITPPPQPDDADFLRQARALLPPAPRDAETWDDATWTGWTRALAAASGRRGRALYHPLRVALTGEDQGPELRALLPLLGHDRVADRLEAAGSAHTGL